MRSARLGVRCRYCTALVQCARPMDALMHALESRTMRARPGSSKSVWRQDLKAVVR